MNLLYNIWLPLALLLLVIACDGPVTERMADYEVHGIDVSHYQSRVDWTKISQLPLHFAFVKATEGIDYKDSLFDYNWSALQRTGLRKGAYHFFRPNLPPGEQARHFARTVKLNAGDLPPVLDVEVMGGLSKEELVHRLQTWLDIVESTYGVKPIIYSNLHFYNRHLAGYFSDYPLWIARYHRREPSLACGSDWAFWQYGHHGRLEGINGHVDFNVFRGSLSQLDAICLPVAGALSSAR
jgi:lysozyme